MKLFLRYAIFAVTSQVTLCCGAHADWKEAILTNFSGQNEGFMPMAPVVLDAAGNLYGTTAGTGPSTDGTVFMLTKPTKGQSAWNQTTLHNFTRTGDDGIIPYAGVIFDASGNLYGTTLEGGQYGFGTVFELSPPSGDNMNWTELILYSFGASQDGKSPSTGLLIDGSRNLYGTTNNGGLYDVGGEGGTVFKLAPPRGARKTWHETIIHSFGSGSDGYTLQGCGLVGDAFGNLYGTTVNGGKMAGGIVFELSPPGTGKSKWKEAVLYSFNNNGRKVGGRPRTGLGRDSKGNLYGTTYYGDANGAGSVFQLTPPAPRKTKWIATSIFSFTSDTSSPAYGAALALDSTGNIFGTYAGSASNGAAFELKRTNDRKAPFSESVLYTFTGNNGDGIFPDAGPTLDSNGNFYSTTAGGGGGTGAGTVYELSP